MIRSPAYLFILVSGIPLAGCAPKAPAELESARVAYQQASSGPAAELVPAEVQKAEEALLAAEAAFHQSPNSYETKDLAYVAQRQAELAEALAAAAVERQSTADANSLYHTTQDAITRSTQGTRENLGFADADLADSLRTGGQAAAELAESRASEVVAPEGLADADVTVKKFDRELAYTKEAQTRAQSATSEALTSLSRVADVKEEARGLVITLSGSVLFGSNESALLPDATTGLGTVAAALLPTGDRRLTVEGHTDSQGSEAYNLELSQRRADSVRDFLTSRGYDPDRVRARGMGESRPVADNATAEGRATNRRVEIIIEPAAIATE